MRFPDGPFGHIKAAGSKFHPTDRLCLTQKCLKEFYGLFRGMCETQLISLRRHLALLWTTVMCIAGTNCPQGSASPCVTQDTFSPVLITYILSQSLKGEI